VSDADLVPLDIVRTPQPLFSALIAARALFGGRRPAIVDGDGRVLTYDDIVRAALALGHALKRGTRRGDAVGIMLPTGAAAVIAFFAVSAFGRIPTMLNFSAGPAGLVSSLKTAVVKRVVTAHRFVEVAKLEALAGEISQVAKAVYLEDVRDKLSVLDKAVAGIGQFLPQLVTPRQASDAPGVILFTSGTEGAPKGVALSHANMLANIRQVCMHEKFLCKGDVLLNPLPIFHSFGLVLGSLLPLFLGLKTVLYPTPLKPREIVQRLKERAATILLATDTFLSQYARAAEAGDFKSLRYAVCGGERVRDETRQLMQKKHGIVTIEGYGTTETSPLATGNQPNFNRPGTVGHLLPEMEARLEPVPGIAGAGRLFLKGPNVMLGYIASDRPGVIVPPQDGWHDTGDIVAIDGEGYVAIRGRQKRFANVGAETVSLAVAENCAAALWPEYGHAAVAVADERKGEQVVLLTTNAGARRDALVAWAHEHGVGEIALPRRIVCTENIPLLVTGKPDYVRIEAIVRTAMFGPARIPVVA
jgi:acyl-[acyl-carrier-protein]-phospholipid O-acyltransferase / long-chain-fatty-acid--[acyl-carrier-protein] ligase